ncbi:MAG: hypothetical protein IJ128_05550 [Firmicutes bacterium]|nr:hypothetical protein [Bacillota bacterium]
MAKTVLSCGAFGRKKTILSVLSDNKKEFYGKNRINLFGKKTEKPVFATGAGNGPKRVPPEGAKKIQKPVTF